MLERWIRVLRKQRRTLECRVVCSRVVLSPSKERAIKSTMSLSGVSDHTTERGNGRTVGRNEGKERPGVKRTVQLRIPNGQSVAIESRNMIKPWEKEAIEMLRFLWTRYDTTYRNPSEICYVRRVNLPGIT